MVEKISTKPFKLKLNQNYPNPFNQSTELRYDVASTGLDNLNIFNILGQKTKSLTNEVHEPGTYSIIWNGKNNFDDLATSGIYFVVLESSGTKVVKKILFLK